MLYYVDTLNVMLYHVAVRCVSYSEGRQMDTPIRTAPDERWLSVREAHEKTGLSVTTIYNAINSGKLRALRRGTRTFRILPADLDRWAETMVYEPNGK